MERGQGHGSSGVTAPKGAEPLLCAAALVKGKQTVRAR